MEIPSENGTQQESKGHSHEEDSVPEQEDECDDGNVEHF